MNQSQYTHYCETTGKYQTLDEKLAAAGVVIAAAPSVEHQIFQAEDRIIKAVGYEKALPVIQKAHKDGVLSENVLTRLTRIAERLELAQDAPHSLYPNAYEYNKQNA